MTKLIPAVLFLSFITFAMSVPAFAIDSINVQTYNPSTSDHFVFLEDGYKSEWPKVEKYYFGVNYNYVSEPLVALDPTQTFKSYNIIDSIQTIDLMFGFKAANNLGLFIGLPVDFINYSDESPSNFPKGSATGIGDMKLLAKIRVTDDNSPTSIAVIPEIHLPTGSTQNFVSDASTYLGLKVAIERQFDTFTLVGNLGFAVAPNAIYTDSTFVNGIDYRKRLIVGIGGFLPITDQWGANLEFNNTSMIPFDKTLNPNDAYLGARYATNDGWAFTGGGSLGKIGGPSGTDYRVVAGIRCTIFEPKKQAPKPIAITPVSAPTGIIDSNAHATMTAEKIEIHPALTFINNVSLLTPESKVILDDVAVLLKKNKMYYTTAYIDAHTGLNGNAKKNLDLSTARAFAVKAYLSAKGVPDQNMFARGFGSRKPKVKKTAHNEEAINDRVEFNFVM